MSDMLEILKRNIKQFMNSAEIVYKTGDFTSASVLYFKCFFSALDFVILRDTGRTPKDHSERFRIIEETYPELYATLDKLYPSYRNTYSAVINKQSCDWIKENVERIVKEQKVL